MSRSLAFTLAVSLVAGIATAWWWDSNGGGHAVAKHGGQGSAASPAASENVEPGRATRAIRIRRVRSEAAVTTDPRAPDYDPVKLASVLEWPAPEVFAAEPRNEPWARPFESQLEAMVAESLAVDLPSATVTEVECRTASCRLSVSVDAELADAAHAYLQTMTPLGTLVSPSFGELTDGRQTVVMHSLLGPDLHEPSAFREFFGQFRDKRQRDGFLDGLRAQHGF